jgi:peptidyl-prolyl cis-trans isomerase SurA
MAVTAASAGLAAMAQQPAQQQVAARTIDGVVATVNDQVISQSDVRNRMRWMLLRFQEQPDEQIMAQIQQQAIEDLIDEKIQLQEFYKLTKEDKIKTEEIDENISDLARQYKMTKDQFVTAVTQAGIPIQSIRDMEEAKIGWGALIRGRYYKSVRVSDLRVDEMLHRIQTSLNKPQYRLAEIFLYAPDQASRTNAMTRAETIIKNVNQGADFSALAQQFSAAPSASAGGDLNWLSPGDMRPEIEEAVAKADKVPSLLPPIESEGGIYVIALTGKREASDPSKSIIFNMEQVVSRGDGAAAKLEALKAKTQQCTEIDKSLEGVEGVTHTPMKDVGLMQVAPAYRTPLEGLDVGQATSVIDLSDGSKMMFFVCEKRSGDPDLPSRDEIKDRLFNQELTLVAERYLRDLKREATIVRR